MAPTPAGTAVLATATSATSATTSSLSVTDGDLLIATFTRRANSGTISTPTNTGTGLTWNAIGSAVTQSRISHHAWWAEATVTESITVTFGVSATADSLAGSVRRVTGADVASPINSTVVTATGTDATPTVNVTPGASSDLIWGHVGNGAARTFSVGSGYTASAINTLAGTGGTSANNSTEYKNATGTTSTAVDGSLSGAGDWAIKAFTIKEAAAGADYTLTADAGSFTLTGQAASLLASRNLTAAAGSFSLAGQAAGLLANRLLTAGQGSYTLSGQDASLLVNRLLTAESGTFTLTGQDASLLASRLLAAESGSFTLTGIDATLTYNSGGTTYTLTADSGSYSLTGQAASLLVSRLLTASAGAYVVTGQDASLLAGRKIAADAGSFTLSGQAASLLVSRILGAGTGSFTLTGQNVTLTYNSSGELQIYTANVLVNITPVASLKSNPSPAVNAISNPSPAREVKSG